MKARDLLGVGTAALALLGCGGDGPTHSLRGTVFEHDFAVRGQLARVVGDNLVVRFLNVDADCDGEDAPTTGYAELDVRLPLDAPKGIYAVGVRDVGAGATLLSLEGGTSQQRTSMLRSGSVWVLERTESEIRGAIRVEGDRARFDGAFMATICDP